MDTVVPQGITTLVPIYLFIYLLLKVLWYQGKKIPNLQFSKVWHFFHFLSISFFEFTFS
jgi:hypothetical protein